MKNKKVLATSILALFTSITALSGCDLFKKKTPTDDTPSEVDTFDFSLSIKSGRNQLEMGTTDKLVVTGDGVDDEGRSFSFQSSNEAVATVSADGTITPVAPGTVSFQASESKSGKSVELTSSVEVVPAAVKATGGFNYSAANDVETRTEILGKLEKYAMDAHLTGITLFDNGGYVKYSSRVNLPTTTYITGYGFGLLREGSISGTLPGDKEGPYASYYHSAISQDPMTINAMNASGSMVSDLSSYITSSYYSTKMALDKKSYEWYPLLAKDSVRKPIVNSSGEVTGLEDTATPQTRPIPLEASNQLGLYKKWRIYLKTGDDGGLKYRFTGSDSSLREAFDQRKVALADYEWIYKFILTGKNGMSRGSEMAADTSYGIKGALKFYNDTINRDNQTDIDNLWNKMKAEGELGINTGTDDNGGYIDLELINPIDDFTAMYTLSSSLVSPLPEAFFKAIGEGGSIIDAAAKYGNFNNTGEDGILNYVLNLGAYSVSKWTKKQQICFTRNDSWFEVNTSNYKIPGIYNRVIDTSTDVEAVYKQFNDGNLDVCGIPTSKISLEKDQPRVYQTKGDATFKLNVNSCTQEEWNDIFESNKYPEVNKTSKRYQCKAWMSNDNFLDGLFFAINRKEFADKRGVQPSINYFSDAYLSDPIKGESYNESQAHKKAVANYHSVGADGKDNYGYDYGRAVKSFKAAVNELTSSGKLVKGTKSSPQEITINICWMYPTDPKEYGDDIANYFESAFNDEAVSGGTVKLRVINDYVTNWEDVYNKVMMVGQYDLGFGAISGNTYNPLNFLQVLMTDNSSHFTLNWGEHTDELSEQNPIYYNGKKWSFDALWACADHGGLARNGIKVEPVQKCYKGTTYTADGSNVMGNDLYLPDDPSYDGYKVEIPLQFEETENVLYTFNRLVINAAGVGNTVISNATYNPTTKKITAIVSKAEAKAVDEGMYNSLFKDDGDDTKFDENSPNHWKLNPFDQDRYNYYWTYEVYYTMTIKGSRPSENYVTVKANSKA